MSTLAVDTITGKSTSTNLTIGSTPVVSASANSLTIRGEGTAHTSIQQGLIKAWVMYAAPSTSNGENITAGDSHNVSTVVDNGNGQVMINVDNNMASANYVLHVTGHTQTMGCLDTGTQTSAQVRMETYFHDGNITNSMGMASIAGDLA
jgi:hypothetical protein